MLEVKFLLFGKHGITARVLLELIALIEINYQHTFESSSVLYDHMTLIVSMWNTSYSTSSFCNPYYPFLVN